MLLCTTCNQTLPFTEFHLRRTKTRGYAYSCKNCIASQVKRNKQACRDFINNYLLNNPCVLCGESRIYCLDFDHLDPTSKYKEIGAMVGSNQSLESIKQEIEKCRVLCANCHREHTAKTNQWSSWLYAQEINNSSS